MEQQLSMLTTLQLAGTRNILVMNRGQFVTVKVQRGVNKIGQPVMSPEYACNWIDRLLTLCSRAGIQVQDNRSEVR